MKVVTKSNWSLNLNYEKNEEKYFRVEGWKTWQGCADYHGRQTQKKLTPSPNHITGWHRKQKNSLLPARKRSLRRSYFHRCLSVHRGWSRSLSGGISALGSLSGGLCPVVSLSMGVSIQGVSVWGSLSWRPPTVTRGRYASHWNAFLLLL